MVDECKLVSKKHVKIVEENVCKDVLVDVNETICDGDDSSNDGKGNNGEDGDDSNSNNGSDGDGKNISGKKENNDSGDKGINKNTGNDSEEDIDSNNVDTYGPPKAPLYTPKPSNGNEDSGNDEDSKTDDGNKGPLMTPPMPSGWSSREGRSSIQKKKWALFSARKTKMEVASSLCWTLMCSKRWQPGMKMHNCTRAHITHTSHTQVKKS